MVACSSVFFLVVFLLGEGVREEEEECNSWVHDYYKCNSYYIDYYEWWTRDQEITTTENDECEVSRNRQVKLMKMCHKSNI